MLVVDKPININISVRFVFCTLNNKDTCITKLNHVLQCVCDHARTPILELKKTPTLISCFFFFVLDFLKSKFCLLSAQHIVFPFLAIDTEVDGFCPQAGLFNRRGHNRVQRLSSSFAPLLSYQIWC